MGPLALMAIGAGTGLLQTHMQNKAQAKANQANAEMAAAQTRFSPYTKMGAGSFQAEAQKPMINGALTGGMAGLNLSQAYNRANADTSMMEKQSMGLDSGQQQQFVQQELNPSNFNPYTYNMRKQSYGNIG